MLGIYQPSEDSYLMQRILKEQLPILLKENPDLKFLEIGAGSGIHLETASQLGIKQENIFSSDIDIRSVDYCNSLGFNCIHSDLFEGIDKLWYQTEAKKRCHPSVFRGRSTRKTGEFPRFDLIIFNPPYLPEDKHEPTDSKPATTGGKKGSEIIIRFLEQAKNYLNKNGKIFLITSSLSKKIDFFNFGYKEKEIGSEKLFFERLCLWEIKVKD